MGLIVARFGFGSTRRIDDQVWELQNDPKGMFYYNQRALFLVVAIIFLAASGLLFVLGLPANGAVKTAYVVLSGACLLDIALTLVMHRSFVTRLRRKGTKMGSFREMSLRFSSLFDVYFLMDFLVILLMILVAVFLFNLPFQGFSVLLLVNMLVYGSYSGRRRVPVLAVCFILFVTAAYTLSALRSWGVLAYEGAVFRVSFELLPLVSSLLAGLFLVLNISRLSMKEHMITQTRLELLGQYEEILLGTIVGSGEGAHASEGTRKDSYFRSRIYEILKDLCTNQKLFWYRSACLWFVENHKDRGDLLLPGPAVRFDEWKSYRDGLLADAGLMGSNGLVLIPSLKHYRERDKNSDSVFRGTQLVPAAYVPLGRRGKRVGILTIFGEEGGLSLQFQDEAFLRSFGSVISGTLEQSQHRHMSTPYTEMDDLFKCASLDQVFPLAAEILRRYLVAAGCMVIFRRHPSESQMSIVAKTGLSDCVFDNKYEVGRGKTGECARMGETLRVDDVGLHRHEFNAEYLGILEEALGKPIVSWMAIPIGKAEKNFGVIKVVNRTFRCAWFTEEDQRVGEALAQRLHVIIDKFLHISHTESARESALKSEAEAKKAAAEARRTVLERQEELMVMTHQLLGPLASMVGAISSIRKKPLSSEIGQALEHIDAFVEDAIAVCYGTSTSFAKLAGKKAAFVQVEIDALVELEKLAKRLQFTNDRNDLHFQFRQDANFPILKIDRNVFVSVMYSLIHNATKYADPDSDVDLECSFEQPSDLPALKLKSLGEPINPDETERIFHKFERGKTVESTGRHHGGIGVGLWVARELMRALGGDLEVVLSPQHPRLSVFVVYLPKSSYEVLP